MIGTMFLAVSIALFSFIFFGFGVWALYKVRWIGMDSYERGQVVKLILWAPILGVVSIAIFSQQPRIEPMGFFMIGILFGLFGGGVFINYRGTRLGVHSKIRALFMPVQSCLAFFLVFLAFIMFLFSFF